MESHKVLFISNLREKVKKGPLVFKYTTKSEPEIAAEIEGHLVEWGRKGYQYLDLKPHTEPNASGSYPKPRGYFLMLKKK